MMDREMKLLLEKVQISRASHQKNVKILENMYKKAHYDRFKNIFIGYLRKAILKNSLKNEYIERTLDFMANFVSVISLSEETNEDMVDSIDSSPVHTFLKDIIEETLAYHENAIEAIRYHACMFVQLILHYLGNQVTLDNDICDTIQDAMLERTMDPKSVIRLHAIIALARLQDPSNKDCPVINAYLVLMKEPNARIRAEVVKIIAPAKVHNVAMHIKDRLRDVDHNVRSQTFKRIGELSPRFFRIIDRQDIMKSGIIESNEVAKKSFTDYLLPKWLNFYERNFILLLNSLKFDAEEADLITTEEISKDVLNIYLKFIPIEDTVKSVPINQEKLILKHDLSLEAVLLWNLTVTYLRQSEDLEEYLEQLVPELTPFCNYIESIINEFHKRNFEEYEKLDYYSMLYYLFEMAEQFDFTDEVGRRTLYQLVMKILKQERFQFRLTKKLVEIAYALTNKNDDFTNIMCEMISEIREPLVAVITPSKQPDDMSKNFQIAALKVKLDRLEIDLETAKDKQEFLQANELKQQITHLRKELEEIMKPVSIPTEMVKTVKDDPSTICWCLDLLIAVLELPEIAKLTPSLLTVKDTFVMPLLDSSKLEINWRVLNVLALYATVDPSLAEALVKILCIPIITYRVLPNHVKEAILVAIKTVSDMFKLYGSEIFGQSESSSDGHQTRRRLYTEEADESLTNPNNFNLESLVDILLDMMDDDNSEIIETSALALIKLMLNGFPVTSAFVTRIILKWINPVTVNVSSNLQQLLGIMLGNYSNSVKGAKDNIAKAVIPILTSIAGAPSTSPLSEVDTDNLIQFLAAITNPDNNQVDVVNTHVALAHSLCHEILKKKNPQLVYYLTKMLKALEIPSEDKLVLEEVITQAEMTLEEDVGLEKLPKKYVEKFVQNLKAILERDYTNRDSIIQMEITDTNNTENNTRADTISAAEKTICGEKDKDKNESDQNGNNVQNENLVQNNSDDCNKPTSDVPCKENNGDPEDNAGKTLSATINKDSEETRSAASNEKINENNKQNKQAAQKSNSSQPDKEKEQAKSSEKKRPRRGVKQKLIAKTSADDKDDTSTSNSDIENHVKKKHRFLRDKEEIQKGKRKKQVNNIECSSTSENDPEPKRRRVSPNHPRLVTRTPVRMQVAVPIKRLSSNTMKNALKRRHISRNTPRVDNKTNIPRTRGKTLPNAENKGKNIQIDTTSSTNKTSQSGYDETPRPTRKNGLHSRLSQILSTSGSSQSAERNKSINKDVSIISNSQGSSNTSSPSNSFLSTPKDRRKNGVANRLLQRLSTRSEGNVQKVQKAEKYSNKLSKRKEMTNSESSISSISKSVQETSKNKRKSGVVSRLSQDSRTSSESSSPRVPKTPSALDILNKNREKRNSEGKQREIRIPKRFSDQSESSSNGKKRNSESNQREIRIPRKSSDQVKTSTNFNDKMLSDVTSILNQKAPENLQCSKTAKNQDNKHIGNSAKSKEKNSEKRRILREKPNKPAVSSVILREKNSQGPKNPKDQNQHKTANSKKNIESGKSLNDKNPKIVQKLKKMNSENSKGAVKLRRKGTESSTSSDERNQKNVLSSIKRVQQVSGDLGSSRKLSRTQLFRNTPHVKGKAKQNLLERITEASVSSESRTSSRRSRSSLGLSKLDDSGDSTILHTILHEVSHNMSLMDTSDISNSSIMQRSHSSSSISFRSTRSNSIVLASGSVKCLRHRSRLRKK